MSENAFQIGRVGFADQADVDLFVATLERYEKGELDADAWRAFRLLNGVYGQRQEGVQMLRVKIPQGILNATQMRRAAQIARQHGGRAHVTTRQNFQFYFLPLAEAEDAMRRLAEVGLTSKEACGHSVRNVTAPPLAGVDPDEIFDVTPYADALAHHFIRGPRSSSLPRKFKIAFEGSPRGEARAAINDLAFVAGLTADGRRTFRVLVGGGTSTLARVAAVLVAELPAGELLGIAEAVVRVFHAEGERKNRAKARIKWLIKKLGWPAFQARVLAEYELVKQAGSPSLPFDAQSPPELALPAPRLDVVGAEVAGFAVWRRTNVLQQKQAGRVAATVTLRLGDLLPEQLESLATLSERFSDGTVRTTVEQNLVFRHVTIAALPSLYRELAAMSLGSPGAGSLADVTSCAGADTCAIAVTASRGMGALITDAFADSAIVRGEEPGLDGAQIKVSGCPNGCGQHHIASIGLQGGMRKVGGRALPLYHLSVGGGPSRFARLVGKIPARRGALAVERLLSVWRKRGGGVGFDAWLAEVPVEELRVELRDLFDIDERSAVEADFVDLGQTGAFVIGEGEAECAQ